MRTIGRIKLLQIQTASLKTGVRPTRLYSPDNLLSLSAIKLSTKGVVGVLADGGQPIDVHHAEHPDSRNRTDNGVSINFIPHYDRIRRKYGRQFVDGCAGENILVETDESFEEASLANGVVILGANGRQTPLSQIFIAAPCEPFSRYLLQMEAPAPAALVKQTLQFLNDGARGFYTTLEGEEVVIHVGDEVAIL